MIHYAVYEDQTNYGEKEEKYTIGIGIVILFFYFLFLLRGFFAIRMQFIYPSNCSSSSSRIKKMEEIKKKKKSTVGFKWESNLEQSKGRAKLKGSFRPFPLRNFPSFYTEKFSLKKTKER